MLSNCVIQNYLSLYLLAIQLIWKRLHSTKSSWDHGTLYQLRNLIQCRNVSTKPFSNFDAHDNFFNLVVTAHVLSAAMELQSVRVLYLKTPVLPLYSIGSIPPATTKCMHMHVKFSH